MAALTAFVYRYINSPSPSMIGLLPGSAAISPGYMLLKLCLAFRFILATLPAGQNI